MNAPAIAAICYDLNAVSRFFRSVALAVSFQQHTQIEWVTHRDSGVMNAMYSVLFWKTPPGVVEVRQSNNAQIQQTTDKFHEQYLMVWLRKLNEQGPVVANTYVTEMGKIRDHARDAVNALFQDASEINLMVAGELKQAITDLARIKLAGTVGVAVLGATGAIVLAPAGALICSGVSLGFSSTCSLIKTWEQGSSAKAVGIEVGKAASSELLGGSAGASQVKALAQQGRAEQIIRSAEGEIRKFSQRLSQEGLRKAQIAKARNIVQRAGSQVAGQQQIANQAGRTARLAGIAKVGVPMAFAAWDIWEGISDYNETVGGL